jgi:UDP-N-acetyl-D-glucosamine dehydrogenase
MAEATSTAPNGEQFPLPTQQDEAAELQRLQALTSEHRVQGHEIVVVLGVGFVGAVMAGIVADSVDKTTGRPGKAGGMSNA